MTTMDTGWSVESHSLIECDLNHVLWGLPETACDGPPRRRLRHKLCIVTPSAITSVKIITVGGNRSPSYVCNMFINIGEVASYPRKTQPPETNRVVWNGGSQGSRFQAIATILCDYLSFHIVSDPSHDKNRVVWGLSKAGLALHNFELTATCDSDSHKLNRSASQAVVTLWTCSKYLRDCVLTQENTIARNQWCSARCWIARVPISGKCHDPLRWPVVSYRIRSNLSHDINRVVWDLSQKDYIYVIGTRLLSVKDVQLGGLSLTCFQSFNINIIVSKTLHNYIYLSTIFNNGFLTSKKIIGINH